MTTKNPKPEDDEDRCIATLNNGERCKLKKKLGNYCTMHYIKNVVNKNMKK